VVTARCIDAAMQSDLTHTTYTREEDVNEGSIDGFHALRSGKCHDARWLRRRRTKVMESR
jgi:hypothetical protein